MTSEQETAMYDQPDPTDDARTPEFEALAGELSKHEPVTSFMDNSIVGCLCMDRHFQESEGWGTHLAEIFEALAHRGPVQIPSGHAKDLATSAERVKNGADSSHVTPTDDERDEIFEALADRLGEHPQARNYEIADSGEYETKLYGPIEVEVLAEFLTPTVLGFHRTVQGEPSDAAVDGSTSDGYHTFDELYDYRMLYHAHAAQGWLAQGVPVVKSWRHSDGEPCFGGGWFIMSAAHPAGQITNHYKAEHWGLFDVPEVETPPEYDGHTPQDVAHRLRAALRNAVQGGETR